MTHVFVAPHPDDVALSCGGLIASLRELGQNVTIITVFSGNGPIGSMTDYQREALGFGSKAIWPNTEAFNRANLENDFASVGVAGRAGWLASDDSLEATQTDADAAAKRFWQRSSWYRRAEIRAKPQFNQPLMDDVPAQGAVLTDELIAAEAAGDIMATRRLEDERFAYYSEASIIFLDLPDAVFRGYEGDRELLGEPRADDPAPLEILSREIARLEPQKVYLPLGVGGHVDHQLLRQVGVGLLTEGRRWVMPGPDYAGIVTFYEDFPYAWWDNFGRLEELPSNALQGLPVDVAITPELCDISDTVERKINGIRLYASQVGRLFGSEKGMGNDVRGYNLKLARLAGIDGYAERYWSTYPI